MTPVLLPIKTVSVLNTREHHQQRARRAALHRRTAFMMMKSWGTPPALPMTITMTRISVGTLDDDNLASAFKAARDGVADWLGVDDGDTRITWVRKQKKGKRLEYGVIVEVGQ
ncbi:MAG: hypothetical protein V4614_15015 [Pseudomonadota bacterium]